MKGVERLPTFSAPLLPLGGYFADCGIGATWHITDDPIVPYTSILANLAVFVAELWENLRIVISNKNASGVQAVHLVCQHEGSLRIGVIRYNEAIGLFTVRAALFKYLTSLDELKKLGGLASRRGAHVQDCVVRSHIQKHRRHHAYDLLSRNEARVSHLHD